LLLAAGLAVPPSASACEVSSFASAERLDDRGDAVLLADLKHYGVSDVVLLDRAGRQVVVDYGTKKGPVTTWRFVLPVPRLPVAHALGDMNGDGNIDLVVTARPDPGADTLRVFVAMGRSFGEFLPFADSGAALRDRGSLDLAVEDVTGDGRPDVVLLAQNPGSQLESDLVVLPGDGAGGVGAAIRTPVADGAVSFALGDFDTDGVVDAALAGANVFGVDARRGTGAGKFGPAARFPVLSPRTRRVRAFDLDADGRKDLVVVGETPFPPLPTTVLWNLSHGAGEIAFGEAARLEAAGASAVGFDVAAGDLTNDGATDVVVAAGSLAAFPRVPGTRAFGPPVEVTPGTTTSVALGDMNGDGKPDVVAADGAGSAWVTRNTCGLAAGEETLFVPVLLDLPGAAGTRHKTDLGVKQRGESQPVDVEMEYTATAGGGSGSGRWTLVAREAVILPAFYMLDRAGVPVTSEDSRLGTLRLRFRGLDRPLDAVAGAAVLSNPDSLDATLVSMPAFRPSQLLRGPAVVAPLRRDALDRSNFALVNAGTAADGPVTLRVTLSPAGPGGAAGGAATRDVTLPAGGFTQLDDVLALLPGAESAIARVERIAGEAPYVAWGVLHDRASGDASLVPAVDAASGFAAHRLTVPVAMESPSFESELLLANASGSARSLRITFAAPALSSPGGRVRLDLALPAGAVVTMPRFVAELRARGIAGVPPPGPLLAGPVVVEPADDGTLDGIAAGARTTRTGARRVGVYGAGIPDHGEATTVSRGFAPEIGYTNVAIVNLAETEATFRVETRLNVQQPKVVDVRVPPLGWVQVNETGGSVKVERLGAPGPFVSYLVEMLRRGTGGPGIGAGDGAWVPMEPEP
jgi:hypothetical protein